MSAPPPSNAQRQRRPGAVTAALLMAALVLPCAALTVMAIALARDAGGLARWFVALLILGVLLVCVTAVGYVREIWRRGLGSPAGMSPVTAATLLVLPVLIVCGSSLHQFYPFRPSVVAAFPGLRPMLQFNLAFAAAALLMTVALAVAYAAGWRRASVRGIALVGVLLLIPNDDCPNPFNRPWLAMIGASPLMFAPAALGVALAGCGLCGLWPRWSLAIAASLGFSTLLLGWGHMTGSLW